MGVQGLKRIGLGITAIWVGVIVVYVWFGVEPKDRPWNLAPNNFGDFLAGTVGPVAFFWLMLAFFIQSAQLEAQSKSVIAQEEALKATQAAIELQRQSLDMQREELQLQRKELELQRQETARMADEASKQAVAVTSNELHARRDVFFRQMDLTKDEINRIIFLILPKIANVEVDRKTYGIDILHLRRRYYEGEKNIFFDVTINICLGHSDWLKGAVAKVNECDWYLRRAYALIENVLKESEAVDPSGTLTNFLAGSVLGETYEALSIAFSWERKFRKD